MAVDNKYGFFRDIKVDEDGNVLCKIVDEGGTPVNTNSKFNFYKNIRVEDGYLIITVV